MKTVAVCVFGLCAIAYLAVPCHGGVFAQSHHLDGEACMEEAQSPIDFDEDIVYNKAFCDFEPCDGKTVDEMLSGDITRVLKDDGHKVQMDFLGSHKICIAGGGLPEMYDLVQYHFHWGRDENNGSEHTVCDQHYPMEGHFVFHSHERGSFDASQDKPMGVAVFGFFFDHIDGTEKNPYLMEIYRKLLKVNDPGESKTFTGVGDHSLIRLIYGLIASNNLTFWRYHGSITSGEHFESVIWTVFKDPIHISQSQLDRFREVRDSHGDPIEETFFPYTFPLNDRFVYTNHADGLDPCKHA